MGALFLTKSVCDGKTGMVGLVLVLMAATFITLAARERIWVLVPIGWCFTGTIPALEIPLGVRDILVLWVFGAFLIFTAFKFVRSKPDFGMPDLLLGVTLAYLLFTFVRNPVGINAFGSDRVGGRPYFTVFIGALSYAVLRKSSLAGKSSDGFAKLLTGTRMLDGIAAQFLVWVPALLPFFAIAYHSDFLAAALGDTTGTLVAEGDERLVHLVVIGAPILAYLAAKFPLSAIFDPRRPLRLVMFALGAGCIMLSGFRSAFAMSAAIFAVAGYFHRGSRAVLKFGVAGLLALIFLLIGHGRLFELPFAAQRAFSFLPGKWDSRAVADAKGSTLWRTEMWDTMLNTNLYLDNHMLGDGFGFKKRDFERIQAITLRNSSDITQEEFLVMGAVHSGPVSAIRFVGYVGLAIHLCLLIAVAILAWRLCKQAKGTAYQCLVYMTAIPLIIEPLNYVFVFGGYENSVPATCLALGMLRMLQNSLKEHAQAKGSDLAPYSDAVIRPKERRSAIAA